MSEALSRLRAAVGKRYIVQRELGSGGMATVYLAEDRKHHRKVAVKVLRPELSAILGGDRFLKEIEVTANLQHPNILALYDSGEADSFLYYVMPYIEGESLRQKLDREKQLGVEEAVGIATSVAAALQYAHEQGVVHRDIKPENILLQRGQPLVADFGIALAVSQAGGTRLTETGLSLGTPHYMSPEQATGDRDLDARSDVYSLGATTYEMLVGDPPHTGSTAQAIVAKILTDDPRRPSMLRATVPPPVDAAILKALQRLPADRFRSAAEFARALVDRSFNGGTASRSHVVPGTDRRAPLWRWLWPVGMAALFAWGLWGWVRPAGLQDVVRFGITEPLGRRWGSSFDLSPDGRALAYVDEGGVLWVRSLAVLEPRRLAVDRAWSPRFSPDGRTLVVTAGGAGRSAIYTVPVSGGSPTLLADGASSAAWIDDDEIVFARDGALYREPVGRDEERLVARPDSSSGSWYDYPSALPAKDALLAVQGRSADAATMVVHVSLSSGAVTPIVQGAGPPRFVGGRLFYVADGSRLVAARFDPAQAALLAEPVLVASDVPVGSYGYANFAVSESGTLMYLAQAGSEAPEDLVWVDRQGREELVDPSLRDRFTEYGGIALSPDGQRLAIEARTDAGARFARHSDIWLYDLVTRVPTRLTLTGTRNHHPAWVDGGRALTFVSDRDGAVEGLYYQAIDGSSTADLIFLGEESVHDYDWSRDGSVAALNLEQLADGDIGFASASDGMGFNPLLDAEWDEHGPALSPNAKWMAYHSDEAGQIEVYVMRVPDGSRRVQVSADGGHDPFWSHSGRELFYWSASDELVALAVTAGETFEVRGRRTLFLGRPYDVAVHEASQALSADDQRFLLIKRGASATAVVVVLNVLDELRRRAED